MSGLVAPRDARRPVGAIAGLSVVTLGCWAYLVAVSAAMGRTGSALAMPMTSAWSRADFMLMWTMWAVMMAAMMLPAATPMVSAYARTVCSPRSSVHGSIPGFVGGYVAVWSGFALLAAGLQWVLHDAALVNAMGSSTSRWLAGPALLLAGAYQFTALNYTMLLRCRSPLGFLLEHWREGRRGACLMGGAYHGLLCVGCCWALMGLLFVLGVMNLWWIVLLSTVVLIEKVTRSDAVPRVLGAVMLLWGFRTLVGVWS